MSGTPLYSFPDWVIILMCNRYRNIISTYSQLYSSDSPILTVKHVAPLRQYHVAYAGGQTYVWNVMLGLAVVGTGGRGFGVVRDEHASKNQKTHFNNASKKK